MLLFYWWLGKDIADLQAESWRDSGLFETLRRKCGKEIPDASGFCHAIFGT